MSMNYRAFVFLPGLRLADEPQWESLVEHLEQNHGDLGPVIAWQDEDTAYIIVSTTAHDEAQAAEIASLAVTDSLHATGLGNLYPHTLEIEPADEPELALA